MADNNEILDFQVAVDIRDSLRQVEKFHKEMVGAMRAIGDAAEKMGKTSGQAADKATRAHDDQTEAVKRTTKAYEDEAEAVEGLEGTIQELEKAAKKASDSDKREIQERIDRLKEEAKARKTAARVAGQTSGQHRHLKGKARIGGAEAREIKSNMKETGQAMVEPLKAFLQRDAKGFLESSFKGAGKFFSKDTAKALGRKGDLAMQRGNLLSSLGSRKGGVKGGMMKMQGAGFKGLGKLTKMMAPLVKTFAKLGPILGMVGGAVMAIVKLFLDADSMVKGFNKEILQSASTIEYMRDQGVAGIDTLENSLEELAKAAHDPFFNNELGITKDEHKAILNVLTQEGVSLKFIDQEAARAGKSMGEMSKSIVAAGVAYSRALGVPLQEINQLQAEMVTEMGSSLEQTELAFAQITRAAAESGIAGNKFFQMIKGVSQDLSVWNMRMEDSVKLLGQMGKIMSPRSAQKFFQEMSSGFKQMGRQDLLKQAMIAGAGATREANKGTLDRMSQEIASTLDIDVSDVQSKSFDQLYALLQNANVDPSQMGNMIQRLNEFETVRQGSKGGTYSQAYATRHVDTAGQLRILESALERFGGTLENPGSMAIGAVADALGKSPDFVEALANLKRTASAQKEMMLAQAKTPEERKKIEGMSEEELINELGSKLLPKSDEEVRDMALKASQKQGQLTQDLLTKFSNFVDGFMVQFYYLVMDMLDYIKSLYKSIVGWLGEGKFDQGERARGEEGKNLMRMLKTGEGTSKVGEAVSRQVSSAQLIKMMKMAGASDEQVNAARDQVRDKRGRYKQAGGYDAMAVLEKAGVKDPSAVLGKALWALTDKKSSDTFVETLGIDRGSNPMVQTARPDASTLTAAPQGAPGPAPGEGVPSDESSSTASSPEAVQAKAAETTAHASQEQVRVMRDRGIKLSSDGAKTLGGEMLTALRKALYEYYLYSGTDRQTVAKAFGKGGPTAGALSALTTGASEFGPGKMLEVAALEANATGGTVTGISNGMAVVAAQGEGLASVGRGERIVPAGSGGDNISVSVNGVGGQDLARLIEGKVVDGIREYKRREKLY